MPGNKGHSLRIRLANRVHAPMHLPDPLAHREELRQMER
jgi:hypothetical protein